MKPGFFVSMAAIATVAAVVSLTPVSAAGQTEKKKNGIRREPRTGSRTSRDIGFRKDPPGRSTFPTYTLEGGHPFDERQTAMCRQRMAAEGQAQQWARALKAHERRGGPAVRQNSLPALGAREAAGEPGGPHPPDQAGANRRPSACHLAGVPRHDLLEATLRLFRPLVTWCCCKEFGQRRASSRWRAPASRRKHPTVAGRFARPLGRQHADRRNDQYHRQVVRPSSGISTASRAGGRALLVRQAQHDSLRGHDRGPESVYTPLDNRSHPGAEHGTRVRAIGRGMYRG